MPEKPRKPIRGGPWEGALSIFHLPCSPATPMWGKIGQQIGLKMEKHMGPMSSLGFGEGHPDLTEIMFL